MSGSFYKQNPLNNYYRGPVRQRGSGLGSLALKVARHALPIFSKYVLPSAKRVGKEFAVNLLQEVFDLVTGQEPPLHFKKAIKRAAGKTVKKQLGTGGATKNGRKTKKKSVPTLSRGKNSRTSSSTTKRPKKRRDGHAKRLKFFTTYHSQKYGNSQTSHSL